MAVQPHVPNLDWSEGIWAFLSQLDFENFIFLAEDDLYWKACLSSFRIATISTILALPIRIFSAVRLGVSPEINALSAIMIAIVTVGVISASLISKCQMVRQKREEQAAFRAQ